MRIVVGIMLGLGALVGTKDCGGLAQAEPTLVIGHPAEGMWVEADCPGWSVTLEQREVRHMGCSLTAGPHASRPSRPRWRQAVAEPEIPSTLSTDDLERSVFDVSTDFELQAYTVVAAEPGWRAGRCTLRLLHSESPLTTGAASIQVERDGLVAPGQVRFVLPDHPDLLAGVGLELEASQPGVRVTGVLLAGPAAAGGVDVGDQILAVDGEPVDGQDLWAVVDRMVGEVDTEVELTVSSPEGAQRLVSVSRRLILDGPSSVGWRRWRR